MSPPSVYELTSLNNHHTSRIAKIVHSILELPDRRWLNNRRYSDPFWSQRVATVLGQTRIMAAWEKRYCRQLPGIIDGVLRSRNSHRSHL